MSETTYRDETGDEELPPPEPSKKALAMKRYRLRKLNGERAFWLYCSSRFIDVMIEEGFLPRPTTPQDITERLVNEAVYKLLNAWRHRPR